MGLEKRRMVKPDDTVTLVTGGGGRLGLALVRSLVERGERVRIFDLPQALEALNLGDTIETVAGDIGRPEDVETATRGVSGVIHLAAVMPSLSEAQPELAHEVNVIGTRNLLDALPRDVHFVFASSVAVYGVPQSETALVNENHPRNPINNYGETKKVAEELVRGADCSWTILRIAPIAVPAVLDLPEPWPFITPGPAYGWNLLPLLPKNSFFRVFKL